MTNGDSQIVKVIVFILIFDIYLISQMNFLVALKFS